MDEAFKAEMVSTIQELTAAPSAQIAGAVAGATAAAILELYARIETLETKVFGQAEAAAVVEMPPPVRPVGDLPIPMDVPPIESPPSDELSKLRLEKAALEARVAALRARQAMAASGQGQVATGPIVMPAGAQSATGGFQGQAVQIPGVAHLDMATRIGLVAAGKVARYEVRHTEGPLVGRPDMVGIPLEADTLEAANAAIGLIAATRPGWRDRLFVYDRAMP